MSKLTDAELSLAVARIMWPEYPFMIGLPYWKTPEDSNVVYTDDGWGIHFEFDHTTDDALGKMCVWLAKYELTYGVWGKALEEMLAEDNPHRAIAEAILEAANDQ